MSNFRAIDASIARLHAARKREESPLVRFLRERAKAQAAPETRVMACGLRAYSKRVPNRLTLGSGAVSDTGLVDISLPFVSILNPLERGGPSGSSAICGRPFVQSTAVGMGGPLDSISGNVVVKDQPPANSGEGA